MLKRGKFIVIEGTDGSGKTTQFKLLVRALRRAGQKVEVVDFPQYGKPSAYFVEQYLNGNFGSARQVGPYQASLFYAFDRFQAASRIRQWISQGRVVVANRYVLSSAGHQGAKFTVASKRQQYWNWLLDLEYKVLGIPKPTLNILLHMPAARAQQLALADRGRKARAYLTGKKKDIHEGSAAHLRAAERSYLAFARRYRVPVVECVERGKLLTPQQVYGKLWQILTKEN